MPGPERDDEPVAFKRSDARRIRTAVHEFERGYRNDPPGKVGAGYGSPLRHAQVTTAITARAGTTPGTGQAKLFHLDGTTLTQDGAGVIVDVANIFAATIAVGKWIMIAAIDGRWSIIAADC